MAEYIRNTDIDLDNADIYNFSDLHVGSVAFHEEAFIEARDKAVNNPRGWVTFGGDMAEAKKIDSPHFNPEGLRRNLLTIGKQRDAFVELWKPIAEKTLAFTEGNHDRYLSKDIDIVGETCDKLGIPERRGGVQTWLELCGEITLHFWHPCGRVSMPSGAKDPIQREANQKAWLKNRLERLGAGSVHAQFMGHVHACMVVPPIEKYMLFNSGDNVRGRFFNEHPTTINGMPYCAPDARWYAATGTFRRTAMFGYVDYAEEVGYPPMPIAYTITEIREGQIHRVRRVIM